MRSCANVMALVCLTVVAPAVSARGDDSARLLDSVGAIAAPGVPGPLCVLADEAFVVIAGGAGKGVSMPVVAAGRFGSGRVVAFGHSGYFEREALESADTGRLMLNAVRWAAGDAPPSAARLVVVSREKAFLEFLSARGIAAKAVEPSVLADGLVSAAVLCIGQSALGQADLQAVAEFVRRGGGILVAGLGWGWLQLNPGKTIQDHPCNRLFGQAGILWADGTLERTADGGFAAGGPPPALCHAGRALAALAASGSGGKASLASSDAAQASAALLAAVRTLPPTDVLLLPRLRRLREASAAMLIPSQSRPVRADKVLERTLLALDVEEARRLPPCQVRAHPAAAEFPGVVPADARRVGKQAEVDTQVPGWHSTGLYAVAGEVVAVTVPADAAGKGLAIRIGAHTDRLWDLPSWRRVPDVCMKVPLTSAETEAASPFGGLIYIDVPRRCRLGRVAVAIRGAVEAPYYERGRTGSEAWRNGVRASPAPWAELATNKVVLTLPSKAVRGLDDPEELLAFWDRVLDACAELAGMPLDRPRPERYVADVQISAGYMHSGYPIMVHTDVAEVMVDRSRLAASGHGGVWGLWHEMGHNHQASDWTFAGTGEVTVNLFSLYVVDKVCGLPLEKGHDALQPQSRQKRTLAYFKAGPDFEAWKKDPFLGLEMYVQVLEAFGWQPYKKVLAEYRGLAASDRPRTDDEKRDQWMVRLSRAVGRNLGPFFQAWGVPTSESARASVSGLPPWMPEGFPPK